MVAISSFDRATIGGVFDRLERKGFVQRVVSTQDRRAHQLNLTQEGEQLLAACQPVVKALQADILALLSPTKREVILALAHKALGLG